MKRIIRHAVVSLAIVIAATGNVRATAGEAVTYRVASGEIVIVCPLTVGGSFEARTKAVTGDVAARPGQPTALEGAFRADLRTLETGIALRDRHLRENYLEVQKGPDYAQATLEHVRIERLDGKTSLIAALLLHGERREVTGSAELKQQGDRIIVQAQFALRVSEFAIPKPSYLGVGVQDEIQVKVKLTMTPTPATHTTSGR